MIIAAPPSAAEARPLTYEEERGKPMPSDNHAFIQTNLAGEFLKHREFRTASEFTLELVPGEPKTPDLSVLPRRPMDLRHPVLRGTEPPLLVVEIASPSQSLDEMVKKVNFYLAHGVQSAWVVLPPLRQITVFLADGSQRTYLEGVVHDPATGITADLGAVFA